MFILEQFVKVKFIWIILISEQQPRVDCEQLQLPPQQDPVRRVPADRGRAQRNGPPAGEG